MFERIVSRNRIMMLLLLLAGWCVPPGAEAQPHEYSLAVVPQQPALEIFKRWQPLVRYLAEQQDLTLTIKLYADIPSFEVALRDGIPDFAYLNPYHQVMAKTWQDYIPLLRDSSHALVGVLVVSIDSGIHDLQELQGSTIGFPAPNAFGASLYMRALLHQRYGLEFTPHYVRTHANVYRQVVNGDVRAGGGVRGTLAEESPAIRQQLRVIFETPEVAPHPIAAHPRVSERDRNRFMAALLGLRESATGRSILAAIQMPAPVRASYRRDYAPLQSLKLGRYIVESGRLD